MSKISTSNTIHTCQQIYQILSSKLVVENLSKGQMLFSSHWNVSKSSCKKTIDGKR